MSRLTGNEVANLMEAYNAVYAPQELTEEQVWEEVENWVNSLVEEGYDLSEYTWEEMYEYFVTEAPLTIGPGGFNIGGKPVQQGMSPIFNRPRPTVPQKGLSIGPGGFNIGGKPVQQDMSPIFQRPGQPAPTRPATPVRPPAASVRPPVAPARPAAPVRPSAAPTRPSTTSVRPSAPAAVSSTSTAPTRTFNPLMQRTFGYQTGNAPDQVAAASAGRPIPSGSALGAAANPEVRKKLNLPAINLNQSFDPFDVVMGHLLDEGYADNEEAALQIMANMSEEWKQSIVNEGLFGGGGRVSGSDARNRLNQLKGPNLKGPQGIKDTTGGPEINYPSNPGMMIVPLASKSKPNNSQTA
jgi:hypothetical protein